MKEQNIDPKITADQLVHSVDLNINVYTETALQVRRDAANALESALERSSSAAVQCGINR